MAMTAQSKANTTADNDEARRSDDVVETADPNELAEHVLSRADIGTLCRWRDLWYQFDERCYRQMTTEALKVNIRCHLRSLRTFKRDRNGKMVLLDGQPQLVAIRPRIRLVNEVLDALPSSAGVLLDRRYDQPFFVDGRKVQDILVCKNGVLNLDTAALDAPTPNLFTTRALDFCHDPMASSPERWHQFLNQLWPDDPCAIFTLQEWFGYCLTQWTSLQKMLLIVGPKRSGKGTISHVLQGLLGRSNVSSPTLGSVTGQFGLQPLLDKLLCVFSDARLSGRTDHAIVVENLLRISGEDLVTVDRKHLPSIEGQLPTRIMLLTNELPRLSDSSGALASRFITLKLTESFYGKEDHGLRDELLDELPGILNWAIEGRQRLRKRGRFEQPESGVDATKEMEDLSSPVGAFVRECCEIGPNMRIASDRLFQAWREWCEREGRTRPGNKQNLSRDLHTVVPGIKTTQPRKENGGRYRAFNGIDLKPGI